MRTRTDSKTRAKVVSFEPREAKCLEDAIGICDLFAGESIAEAATAKNALQAFRDKIAPPVAATVPPVAETAAKAKEKP